MMPCVFARSDKFYIDFHPAFVQRHNGCRHTLSDSCYGVVLSVCKYLLVPLVYIAHGIAAVPYSEIYVNATAAVFLCYPAMFCASEFFMMPKGGLSVILSLHMQTHFCGSEYVYAPFAIVNILSCGTADRRAENGYIRRCKLRSANFRKTVLCVTRMRAYGGV